MKTGKIPQQLVVVFVIGVIAVAGFVGMRAMFVPESFGVFGHYRADAIEDVKKLPISYAGSKACGDCHTDEAQVKAGGFHRGVACEVCHGPAAAHMEDPGAIKPSAPRDRGLCPLCHNYSPSRPTGFPQILTSQHNPGKPCMTCHKPHDPVPPSTPKECSACHRSIWSQKAVSPHATVDCASCHQVPKEHFTSPRASEVGKPKENTICLSCHLKADPAAGAPKASQAAALIPLVDAEHTGRYLCWSCHYPHFPEGKK